MFQDSTFSTIESLSLNKEQFARQFSSSIFIRMLEEKKIQNIQFSKMCSPNIVAFTKYFIIHSKIFSPFTRAVEADFELISKAFKNQLIIPEFPNFCGILRDIYEECRVGLPGAKFFWNLTFSSSENWNGKCGLLHSSTCQVSIWKCNNISFYIWNLSSWIFSF